MDNRTLLNGDCQQELKKIDDNSIDLICTDPPYGYNFMNRDWDKAVVSTDIWKECLRVLKPGSFAFVMSAPRQDVLSHMIVNLSESGFKTDFTSIYWAYASGFPKAMNISKAVDKKLGVKPIKISSSQNKIHFENLGQAGYKENFDITKPSSEQANKLDGSYAGFQPKPAVEVILVCMKPLSEKNYVEQAMESGKGITWLDDCRVPFQEPPQQVKSDFSPRITKITNDETPEYNPNNKGRFPANLIVSDNSLDDGKIYKPSGEGKLGKTVKRKNSDKFFSGYNDQEKHVPSDEGSFNRYFSLNSWEAQFIITPKPSKSEKNKGLDSFLDQGNLPPYSSEFSKKLEPHKVNDGRKKQVDNPFQRGEIIRQNVHPTVKPISLMKYLITMGSRPKDFVLDPFMGSGTTAVACEQIDRNWIGVEMNLEYCDIIRARIADYEKQMRII